MPNRIPLLFEVLESKETSNLQVCRKVMGNLLRRKIAPVPFGTSLQQIRTVVASLRQRGTPPALWVVNTYWAEEMLPERDAMIATAPVIFFKHNLYSAGLSSALPGVDAAGPEKDRVSAVLGRLTPRLTSVWGFGTAEAEATANRAAEAIARFLDDGEFRHIEDFTPGQLSIQRTLTAAEQNLQAFRAQFELPAPSAVNLNIRPSGSSSSTATAVSGGQHSSSGSMPAVRTAAPAAALAAVPAAKPVKKGITGTIEQLGLSTLLMMMEMEKKTGELVLSRNSQQAHLHIRAGRVVEAGCAGPDTPADATCGAEAVFHVLTWKAGIFEFMLKPIEAPDSIGTSTTSLLMEGARRMDENGG